MIVLDNSEYMRNGDYQPTRFGALVDAVTTVIQTKIDSNTENTVDYGQQGVRAPPTFPPNTLPNETIKCIIYVWVWVCVMSSALRPEVLVTHTKELTTSSKPFTRSRRTSAVRRRSRRRLWLRSSRLSTARTRTCGSARSCLSARRSTTPRRTRSARSSASRRSSRKNNVALDVVAFGDDIKRAGEGGHNILRAFVEDASSSRQLVRLSLLPPSPPLLFHPCAS